MTLETKDIIYLLTYLITFITFLLAVRSMLIDIRKTQRLLKNIIFGERGSLNVVTHAVCKAHLDDIYDKMRRRDQVNEMLLQKVDEIGKNQIIIMTHQGIASPNGVKTFERKKD